MNALRVFVGLALAIPSPLFADTVVFNYETVGTSVNDGAYTVLQFTQGGLSATLTRPGSSFDVIDLSFAVPLGFASRFTSLPIGTDPPAERSLDEFHDSSALPYILTFSQPVAGVRINMAGFTTGLVQLYSGVNGTGNQIGSATGGPAGLNPATSIGAAADGIRSVVFMAGTADRPNSAYYGKITVTLTATPEPATVALAGVGLACLGLIARRKRAA